MVLDGAVDGTDCGGVCEQWAMRVSNNALGSTGTKTGSDVDRNPVKCFVVGIEVTKYARANARYTCATEWLG